MGVEVRASRMRGFTVLELLIVVLVLAALIATAIAAHRHYTVQVNRADAVRELYSYAQLLGRCFGRGQDYRVEDRGSDIPCVTLPAANPEGTYRIEFAPGEPTATTFALVATPVEAQSADTQCGSFTLDHTGRQDISEGTLSAQRCWQGRDAPAVAAPSGSQ